LLLGIIEHLMPNVGGSLPLGIATEKVKGVLAVMLANR
jgi:hypothetical protein